MLWVLEIQICDDDKFVVTSDGTVKGENVLTRWGWDKMAAILQRKFSNPFLKKSSYFD